MKKLLIRSNQVIRKNKLRAIYVSLLPKIVETARESGYAIGLHGSMTRDFDLMAVPWTKRAVHPATLAYRIAKAVCKYPKSLATLRKEGKCGKPHGRLAYVLYLGTHAAGTTEPRGIYIDLSVMPPER